MTPGDPLLGGHEGVHGTGPLLLAAHPLSAVGPFSRGWLGFQQSPKDAAIDFIRPPGGEGCWY
jgi:hypothetical protein